MCYILGIVIVLSCSVVLFFLTEGAHLNLFENCEISNEQRTFLELGVTMFCKDICNGATDWINSA